MPALPADPAAYSGALAGGSSGGFAGGLSAEDPAYRSFIVRLWLGPGGREPLRHCEVEQIQSGEIVEPASLEEVLRFIGEVVARGGGEHGGHGTE